MKFRLPNLSRFSLRTLFVLLTLLAVGLGYVGHEYQIVRERREVMKLMKEKYELDGVSPSHGTRMVLPVQIKLSWIRRQLGDQAMDHYQSFKDPVGDDRKRFFNAFPEAWVWEYSASENKWVPR